MVNKSMTKITNEFPILVFYSPYKLKIRSYRDTKEVRLSVGKWTSENWEGWRTWNINIKSGKLHRKWALAAEQQ